MASELDEVSRLLGNIEGQLIGINERLDDQGTSINAIRSHLHEVDKRTIRNGTIAGLGVSIGVNVIAESLKAYLKTHGA